MGEPGGITGEEEEEEEVWIFIPSRRTHPAVSNGYPRPSSCEESVQKPNSARRSEDTMAGHHISHSLITDRPTHGTFDWPRYVIIEKSEIEQDRMRVSHDLLGMNIPGFAVSHVVQGGVRG